MVNGIVNTVDPKKSNAPAGVGIGCPLPPAGNVSRNARSTIAVGRVTPGKRDKRRFVKHAETLNKIFCPCPIRGNM